MPKIQNLLSLQKTGKRLKRLDHTVRNLKTFQSSVPGTSIEIQGAPLVRSLYIPSIDGLRTRRRVRQAPILFLKFQKTSLSDDSYIASTMLLNDDHEAASRENIVASIKRIFDNEAVPK